MTTVQGGDLQTLPTRAGVGKAAREFLVPYRRLTVAAVVLNSTSSLLLVASPVLVGRLADALLAGDRSAVTVLAVLLLLAALLQTLTATLGRDWLARAGEYVVRDVRDRVAHQLAFVPLRFLERHRVGELLQRSTAEVAALSAFVRETLTEIVVTVSTIVVMLLVLGVQSWQLTLVALVVFAPAGTWLMRRFRTAAGPAYAAESAAEAELTAALAELTRVRSVLVTATPAAKAYWLRGLDGLNDSARRAQLRTAWLSCWIHGILLVELATLAALLAAGTTLVAADTVSVGTVITFVLAGRTLFSGFADLASVLGSLEEAANGAARTHDLLIATAAITAPVTDAPPVSPLRVGDHDLRAENITFGYGADPVLEAFSTTFAAGTRVGLAGRTGSGKSTLVKVLSGLYAPHAGRVTVGGHDLGSLTAQQRAELIALVPQQVVLGAETVADELRLAAPGASEGELLAAAASVGLSGWLTGLPEGLSTPAGSDSPLSAGERQLLALIRVALTRTPILILDEATADIDPATAALVEVALDSLAADRTVIVVAHSTATLARLPNVFEVRPTGLVPVPPTHRASA